MRLTLAGLGRRWPRISRADSSGSDSRTSRCVPTAHASPVVTRGLTLSVPRDAVQGEGRAVARRARFTRRALQAGPDAASAALPAPYGRRSCSRHGEEARCVRSVRARSGIRLENVEARLSRPSLPRALHERTTCPLRSALMLTPTALAPFARACVRLRSVTCARLRSPHPLSSRRLDADHLVGRVAVPATLEPLPYRRRLHRGPFPRGHRPRGLAPRPRRRRCTWVAVSGVLTALRTGLVVIQARHATAASSDEPDRLYLTISPPEDDAPAGPAPWPPWICARRGVGLR